MTALTLRDYQVEDVARLRDAYRKGAKAPLYQLATGGGKTVVFSHIVAGAAAKGTRTLVLAHRRELVAQASKNLDWTGVPHGIIAAGLDRDHDAQVLVGSIQTVVRRLESLPQFGLIVADEAHHAVSKTWSELLASQPGAKLLGVTATPQRLDGKGLGKHVGGPFDALVTGPSTQELVDRGYLARLKVYLPAAAIDVRGVRTVAGDYDEAELTERAAGVTGDAVAEFLSHRDEKRPAATRSGALDRDAERWDGMAGTDGAYLSAIVFCCTVAHAESVAAAFRAAGVRAACVHGGTEKSERDRLIAGLGDGSLDVLTSCELVSEGLDVPSVGCVILLRPTKSLVMFFQQVGRGMRPKQDGSALIVLDHARNALVHGLPTEPVAWSLDGQNKEARAAPEPWACEACGVLNSPTSRTCSECGAARPGLGGAPREILQQDNGKMVEYVPAAFEHVTRLSYSKLMARPRSRAELEAFAKHRGYKPGWVYWRLKDQAEQFGKRA